MWEYTLTIDGMQCGMCEAHVNEVIRQNFPVKKVSSSHSSGKTVLVTAEEVDEECLRKVIGATGYTVTAVERKPYDKKGFSLFHR